MKNIYKITVILTLFLSCVLRFTAYLGNRSFWHDECSLALSIIHKGIFGFFEPLEHVQSAPVLFMMGTKALSEVFSQSETVLRIIPFVCAIASVFAFYFLSKKIFDKKYLIIIANVLFAINVRLIYYAQEFKQYSCDVLFVILAVIFFSRFNIEKLSSKKALLYGFLLFLPFLMSFPYAFVLGAYILYKLITENKNLSKSFWIFFSTIVILGLVYYLSVLLPSQAQMLNTYDYYWTSGFLKLDIKNILWLFKYNTDYFFSPNTTTLFLFILALWGFISSFFSKKCSVRLVYITLIIGLIASLAHIYPVRERVALWSLPLTLIFMLMPFEMLNIRKQKIASIILLMCFVLGFGGYNISYFKGLFSPETRCKLMTSINEDARWAFKILKSGFREDLGEVIVFNDASDSEFYYYSYVNGINTQRYVKIKLVEYSEEFYTQTLSQLPKGYTYWFYYPFDYPSKPVIPYLDKWLKNNAQENYISKYKGGSYVAKVKL